MQISNTTNYNFGQIQASQKVSSRISSILKQKVHNGEHEFVNRFNNLRAKASHTRYADLAIGDDGKVFIIGKRSGRKKEMKSFKEFINNVYNGLQHAVMAEENKFHY